MNEGDRWDEAACPMGHVFAIDEPRGARVRCPEHKVACVPSRRLTAAAVLIVKHRAGLRFRWYCWRHKGKPHRGRYHAERAHAMEMLAIHEHDVHGIERQFVPAAQMELSLPS